MENHTNYVIAHTIAVLYNLLNLDKGSGMKKVWIEPGCITCGACEFVAPEIFKVTDVSRVKIDAPLKKHASAIEIAALGCPVNVIKYEQ